MSQSFWWLESSLLNTYSLELYILLSPYESCYPSRILIVEAKNTISDIKAVQNSWLQLKISKPYLRLKDLTWKHLMIPFFIFFLIKWLQMLYSLGPLKDFKSWACMSFFFFVLFVCFFNMISTHTFICYYTHTHTYIMTLTL